MPRLLASAMYTLVFRLRLLRPQRRVEVTMGSRSNAFHQFLLQQCGAPEHAARNRRETGQRC